MEPQMTQGKVYGRSELKKVPQNKSKQGNRPIC